MTSEAWREAPPETLRSWVRDELPNVVALHRVEAMGNVHRHILVALVSTVVVVDEAQRACPEKIVRINFHRYPRRSYRASADSSCDTALLVNMLALLRHLGCSRPDVE